MSRALGDLAWTTLLPFPRTSGSETAACLPMLPSRRESHMVAGMAAMAAQKAQRRHPLGGLNCKNIHVGAHWAHLGTPKLWSAEAVWEGEIQLRFS